jgi:5-methylthioadenosine/S-adenosylhomocysteine deaminase
MEVNLTPERVRVGARLACAEMLLAGVTTFVDHYFHADQIAAAAVESGIRADLAPTYFSSAGPEAIDAAIATARELSSLNPRITASLGPHATYTVNDDDLRRTAEIARAEGFRIHLHAAETDDQTQSSTDRYGVTPIQVLERTGVLEAGALIAHGCGIRESDLPILERYADRVIVASCPKVYLKLAMGEVTPIKVFKPQESPSASARTAPPYTTRSTSGSPSGWSLSPRSSANTTPSGCHCPTSSDSPPEEAPPQPD